MSNKLPKNIDTAPGRRKLLTLLETYLATCRPPPEADAKKGGGKLANLAGFCRFLGCGISQLQALTAQAPQVYDLVCTTLEDELLTASPSPSLLAYYLKKRLGYEPGVQESGTACGEIQLVFEHNILEDGA